MLWLAGYKRNGLPYGLMKLHELLVRDMIAYFEKGKVARKKIKRARKAVKSALKVAKKKKIKPGMTINLARQALGELCEEIEYTRKVISVATDEMNYAIRRIEEERVGEVLSLIEQAEKHFNSKEGEKAMALLKKSKDKMKNKILEKTRNAVFGHNFTDVKYLKAELQKRIKGTFK